MNTTSALARDRGFAPVLFSAAVRGIATAGPRDCRWPLGDPGEEAFRFCGCPRLARGSYCAVHRRRSCEPVR